MVFVRADGGEGASVRSGSEHRDRDARRLWGFRNYWRLQFFPGAVGRGGGGGGASGAFFLPAFPWSSLAKVLSGVFMVLQTHNHNWNIHDYRNYSHDRKRQGCYKVPRVICLAVRVALMEQAHLELGVLQVVQARVVAHCFQEK